MTKVEITEKGFWQRIKYAIKGVLLGLILIPVSFFIIYYASQREQASEVLENALPISKLKQARKKQLAIYIEGKLESTPISDNLYLKPGRYLTLTRKTEMYAYISKAKTEKKKEGTKEITKTTYYCELGWTDSPDSSANGKGCKSENKFNPSKKLQDFSTQVHPTIIANGKTYLVKGSIRYVGMPIAKISKENLNQNFLQDGKFFYFHQKCISNPKLGCERFSYHAITYDPNKIYTGIGMVQSNQLTAYQSKEGNLYLVIGEGKWKKVLKQLSSQDTMITWILFSASVISFGLGLVLIVGPFLEFIEMIPIIGNFGAGLIRFLLFLFAFIVMGISFLLIEYWYIILISGIVLILFFIFIGKSKKQKAATS